MIKYLMIFLQMFLLSNLLFGQEKYLISIFNENKYPVKNVNIYISDTVFVSDTTGIIKIPIKYKGEEIKIRKFGYYPQTIINLHTNIKLILKKDKLAICKDVKYVDYNFLGGNGNILINLKINDENFCFWGPVYLVNGRDIDKWDNYVNTFKYYDIDKTYLFDVMNCCEPESRLRHENYKTNVLLIYHNNEIRKKPRKHIPNLIWWTKRQYRKDSRIMNLIYYCPCENQKK